MPGERRSYSDPTADTAIKAADRLLAEAQNHYFHAATTGRTVAFTTRPPNLNKPRTDPPSQYILLELLLQNSTWKSITKEEHQILQKEEAKRQVP